MATDLFEDIETMRYASRDVERASCDWLEFRRQILAYGGIGSSKDWRGSHRACWEIAKMSVYDGATRVQDKFGRDVRAFQLATLEHDANGVERLGWALVAGRNEADAARRAHILWPGVVVVDAFKGVTA